MDLLEYQGKQQFAAHGIAVPSGEVASTVEDAVAAADRIGYPCAIKAQVLIGGRGKAGGIKIAADRAEAEEYAGAILGMDIVGPHGEGPFRVGQVWVEGGSAIAAEYYASVILDRGEKKLLAMVSARGGKAMISGRLVAVGQSIDGFELVEVSRQAVTLKAGTTLIEIPAPGMQ